MLPLFTAQGKEHWISAMCHFNELVHVHMPAVCVSVHLHMHDTYV